MKNSMKTPNENPKRSTDGSSTIISSPIISSPIVSASILASDFSRLQEEINAVEKAGADWLHLDVMDGQFVPNISFGPGLIKTIRPHTSLIFDAHLMTNNPESFIDRLIEAGVQWLTFPSELNLDWQNLTKSLHSRNIKVGIALNPETPVEYITSSVQHLDLVLVMAVQPGFGGQSFNPEILPKIEKLRKMRQNLSEKNSFLISVDGGVNANNIAQINTRGVDIVVSGSFIFQNDDYELAIKKLKSVQS